MSKLLDKLNTIKTNHPAATEILLLALTVLNIGCTVVNVFLRW